jgi:hypothetical protein
LLEPKLVPIEFQEQIGSVMYSWIRDRGCTGLHGIGEILLVLAVLLHFRRQSFEVCMSEMKVYLGSLRDSEPDELLSSNM